MPPHPKVTPPGAGPQGSARLPPEPSLEAQDASAPLHPAPTPCPGPGLGDHSPYSTSPPPLRRPRPTLSTATRTALEGKSGPETPLLSTPGAPLPSAGKPGRGHFSALCPSLPASPLPGKCSLPSSPGLLAVCHLGLREKGCRTNRGVRKGQWQRQRGQGLGRGGQRVHSPHSGPCRPRGRGPGRGPPSITPPLQAPGQVLVSFRALFAPHPLQGASGAAACLPHPRALRSPGPALRATPHQHCLPDILGQLLTVACAYLSPLLPTPTLSSRAGMPVVLLTSVSVPLDYVLSNRM